MTVFIIITIYLLSIIGCRYVCRWAVTSGMWLAEDGAINIMWFIPIANTLLSIMIPIYIMGDRGTKVPKFKSKFLRKFTNADLLNK